MVLPGFHDHGVNGAIAHAQIAHAQEPDLSWDSLDIEAASKDEVVGLVGKLLRQREPWVREAFEVWQAEQIAAQRGSAVSELHDYVANSPDVPRIGPADPAVVVIEFFDYNCGFCRRQAIDIIRLIDDMPDVAVAFIEFPVLAPSSLDAAKAALLVHGKGKYQAFHFNMMAAAQTVSADTIRDALSVAGVTPEWVDKQLVTTETDARLKTLIERNWDFGSRLNIRGTPAIIIGDQVISGYVAYDRLRALVDSAR